MKDTTHSYDVRCVHFCRTKLWPALVMRMLIAAAMAFALTAGAASPAVVDHAFSFDMRYDGQDAEVLDYRYGDSKLPVHAPEEAVTQGKVFMSTNVHGPMLRGDFLYVKWRNKDSGQVYEDTVDLRGRLPADITDHRIHFTIKGPQLYVYLISPRPRLPGMPANGPEMYRHRMAVTIYPDEPKQ